MKKLEIILILLSFSFIFEAVPDDYGHFQLTVTGFRVCNGPRRKDCATPTAKVLNETSIIYDLVVHEDVHDIEGKIFSVSDNKRTWKLQMKKLCDSVFWRPFMERFMPFKNCIVPKGTYHMEVDCQELAKKYFGGSFFYGKWSFKAVYFNSQCNFGCSIVDMVLKPK